MIKSIIEPKGFLKTVLVKDVKTGICRIINMDRNNTILSAGKAAMAKSLAGTGSDLYVYQMSFGTDGESGGSPKIVDPSRTGLFSASVADKIVTSSIPAAAPHTVLFTAVLGSTEANGNVINEALLTLKDGTAFSMVTFGGLTKTSSIELTFTWEVVLI